MVSRAAGDLAIPNGCMCTPHGDVLFCLRCADTEYPARFTYLHGFYVRCGDDSLRSLLRELGGNYSTRNNRVMCPYCVSYGDYAVHEGFYRLWRSVELPRARFADAWAGVDKTDWHFGGREELIDAAEALLHGPRLPMMLGRDGLEGTPASVLLARAQALAPGPAASLPGATSTDGWGAGPSSSGGAAQAAAPTSAPASMGATHVAAYSVYPAAQSAPWGSAPSATTPTAAARLASAEARQASLETEVQRLATTVASLQQTVTDLVWRVNS